VLQLPTRKAELAELKRLGLSRDSYGTYTRARRERASVEACAMCLANLTWLKSRAEAYGLLEQLSLAHTANEAAKAAAQAAYALIQRRELGSPPATSCQPPT
jgi:hypothetical protein